MSKTVVGVFKSKDQADRAVEDLKSAGVSKDDISIVTKDDAKGRQGGGGGGAQMGVAGQDVSEGVAWGGGLGGLAGILAGAGALAIPGVGPILAAGPLAAVLTGAVTGGLAGGLVDYGIPEQRGKEYEKRVKEGNVLTVVECSDDKVSEVEDILRRSGGEDVESHSKRSS